METKVIFLSFNLSQVEKKMSDWFMDFFEELEETDDLQKKSHLFILFNHPELLLTLLVGLIYKNRHYFYPIIGFVNRLVYSRNVYEVKNISTPITINTFVNSNQFTDVNTSKRRKNAYVYNCSDISKHANFLKEIFLSIVYTIFLSIFDKFFIRSNYKQLII